MATEVLTKKDYEKIERLGLHPNDRDPSDWLRMVARVFAAYKQVSLDKTIVAYIDGFWILDNFIDGNDVKFVIQKGTCFIDDQFIGFTDDILFKYPRTNLIPGNQYFLVLYYKWSYEFDYNLAEFQVIDPSLYDDQTMLKIASFEYTTAGEINLLPQDLDDQYASNFKKLFEIAKDKIIDSIETMKYHYEVFDPIDNKIDPSVKSGDFVYLDYIDGKYKPARACTKEFDKAVGLYLKNNNNNRDYIIYEGIVDFSDPKWAIDPDRSYFKNLESGSSYYLADGCTSSEVIQDATYYNTQERGKISTYFFPGTVRVGYALDHDKFFVRIDYTADLTIQNFIEMFGDSPRFWQTYSDFYKYYELQGQLQYLIDLTTNNNSFLSNLQTRYEDLENNVNTSLTNTESSLSNLNTKENDLSNSFSAANSSLNTNYNDYIKAAMANKFEQFLLANIISPESLNDISIFLDNAINLFTNIKDTMVNNLANDEYINLFNDSNFLSAKTAYNNIKSYLENTINYLNELKKITCSDSDTVTISYITSTSSSINVVPLLNIITKIKENALKDNPDNLDLDTIILNLNNLYKNENNVDSGYIIKAFEIIQQTIDNIKNNASIINQVVYNKLNYSYTLTPKPVTYNKYNGTLTKNNCPATVTPVSTTIGFDTQTISDEKNSTIYTITEEVNRNTLILLKFIKVLTNFVYFLKNKINILLNEINNYNYSFSTYASNEENYISIINSNNINLIASYNNYLEALNTYLKDKFDNNYYNLQKNYISTLLLRASQLTIDIQSLQANIQNEIAQITNILQTDIDETILTPAKNIFVLSNYQRKVYNYTYLTQRIKIKQFEKQKVSNDIEIVNNKIVEVQTSVPIDQGLLETLNNIKGAFQNVYNAIDTELDAMVAEYNQLRTEFFGLDPISKDDTNFDPGPYFVTDLECLELKD